MKKNRYTVSVGIPAYNEEKNVRNMIESILSQKEKGYVLEKILLVSDASTDRTAEKAQEIKDPKLKVFRNEKNLGQTECQNRLMELSESDILILTDADGVLENQDTLSEMVKLFTPDGKTGAVGGNPYATGPDNFLNRSFSVARDTYRNIRYGINGGHNIFGCMGGLVALAKPFYSELRIPSDVYTNDAYIYLSCIKKGYKFFNAEKARAIHRFPENIASHLKRLKRHNKSKSELDEYFGLMVKREYYIPRNIYLKESLKQFIRHPAETIFIFFLNWYARYRERTEAGNENFELVGS